MKTNQVLTRRMGDFSVYQRTGDGFFNATTLLKQWNTQSGMKKEMKDYFVNQFTQEFINVIVERENLHVGNSPYVKSRASRSNNAGTLKRQNTDYNKESIRDYQTLSKPLKQNDLRSISF